MAGMNKTWCLPETWMSGYTSVSSANGNPQFADGVVAWNRMSGAQYREYNIVPGFHLKHIFITTKHPHPRSYYITANAKTGAIRGCSVLDRYAPFFSTWCSPAGWHKYFTQNLGGWAKKGGVTTQFFSQQYLGAYTQMWAIPKAKSNMIHPVIYRVGNNTKGFISASSTEFGDMRMLNNSIFKAPALCGMGATMLRSEDEIPQEFRDMPSMSFWEDVTAEGN
eukprot:TRINITY_DN33158_c0_g1_i1.p1 TRINITY_DN33158_c0_g1~~TRINITY_DN33158_c0_g1_i1.p1  ORF type:complete len:250 (+),score=48.94 TRINITY_DN33158_c0_g1_i1:85-750(+)